MGVLVDREIRAALDARDIEIRDFVPENVGPNSYDVTLDGSFVEFYRKGVHMFDPHEYNEQCFNKIETGAYPIKPGELILGSTVEYFKIKPGIVAFVHGRSSWARLGLQIHAAGLLDSGWEGNITLEIVNFAPFPILLRKGDKIGQVTFERVEVCDVPYNVRNKSKYDGQVGATESRMFVDYER